MSHPFPSPQPPSTGVEFDCVSLVPRSGVARLSLSGELDVATAPRLEEALSNADGVVVILDLRRLTFMDSSGLHTILSAHARLSDANRRLVLVPGPPAVQQIFEITSTDRVLEFAEAPNTGDQQSPNGVARTERPCRDGTRRVRRSGTS